MEAEKYTAAGSKNVNFGEMEFDTYDSGEAGGSLYNNCMLFVEHMKAGGIIYLDHGVIAEEKKMTKIRIILKKLMIYTFMTTPN